MRTFVKSGGFGRVTAVLALAGAAAVALAMEPEKKPDGAPAGEKPAATSGDKPAEKATVDAKTPRDVKQYNLEKGKAAIQGYDPVAYFPDATTGILGKALEGKENLTFTYRGVTYRFANEKNLEAFKAEPAKFEPAYGGWCAYAMAKGDKVEVDPKSFVVENGRLFLFYKDFFNDTRAKWVKDEANLNPKADASWKKLSGEDPPMAEKCPLCKDGEKSEKGEKTEKK